MDLDWTQGDLAAGLRMYADGEFFEAHEFWENVWKVSSQPERTFLQALIQVAAAHHHLRRNNHRGAISLMKGALRRLQPYPERFAGISVSTLRHELAHRICALEEGASALPAIAIRPQR